MSIRLLDVMTGQQKAKLDGHSDGIITVNFSPFGTTLASGNYDKSFCLWDAKTGQLQAKSDGHTGYINSVNFSLDGPMLAFSRANSIRLWNVKTEKEVLGQNTLYKELLSQIKAPLYQESVKILFWKLMVLQQ